MKRFFTAVLSLSVLLSLLCVPAQAAGGSVSIGEQYSFAGSTSPYYQEECYYASPVVTDLDGDGKLEVLNAAYSMMVMDAATGAEKWRINAGKDRAAGYTLNDNPGRQVFTDMEVLDIDADGRKEIVIGYGDGSISVLNDQGYFKPGWPQKPVSGSSGVRSLAVTDVDGDGRMEIAVGMGVAAEASVWLYRCDGSVVPGWPQLSPDHVGQAYSYGVFGDGIATGDLDNDGLPEIIVPTDNAYVQAYNADGSLVTTHERYGSRPWGGVAIFEDYGQETKCENGGWGWPVQGGETRAELYRAELGHSAALYSDVDGDGKGEVIVTAMMMDRTTYSQTNWQTIADSRYMTAFIFNQDRSRYQNSAKGFDWSAAPRDLGAPLKKADSESMSGGVFSEPVAADLDGDGNQEILFNAYNGKLHCFGLDGKEHGSWPFTLPKSSATVFEYPTAPVCVDINGDGKKEVIFASWTDSSTPNGTNTGVNGAIYVLSHDGKLLASRDIHDGYANYEGQVIHSNDVKCPPVVQDVDGDGKYEVLVNTTYYALCAYELTTSAPTSDYATDVPVGSWYFNAVEYMYKNGMMSGTSPTTFGPNANLSRAMLAQVLYNLEGKPAVSGAPFQDVPANQWYANAVAWAAENGIVSGYGNGRFGPDDPITREQLATILYRYANQKGYDTSASASLSGFSDSASVSGYAQEALSWAVGAKLVSGMGANALNPAGTATRAQVATILMRFCENLKA